MKHPISLGLALALSLLATGVPALAAQREFTEEQLQKALQRYPEADANKDGKLTLEEARAHLRKLRGGESNPSAPAPEAAPAVASTEKNPANAKPAKARRGGDLPKPDFAGVSYGSHPNNKLDLWLAKSGQPTALVVFIHGGGFVGGDKSSASGAALKQCLDAGVSFAAINYRFRTEASINTVLRDCARAVQFLRSKAKDYNFDKTRVATFGGSAGAGTSLWLAFHDDLADPKSSDPVLRESTRLVAAASTAGQATYDITKWEAVLGSKEAMQFYPQESWPEFYGLKTLDELQTEQGRKLRADVDMLGLISPDDPPVLLAASDHHDALANRGDTNHSPKHSEAVKKRCDEAGVPCVLVVGGKVKGGGDEKSPVGFLLKHLGAKAGK
ncbi:MAG: alpha/beta hydrolase [Verrucomicrobia bacterium]|nr:alpha/beta hydrolase [Verrucomicrobiota bacterium]